MHPGEEFSDEEIKRRFKILYGNKSEKALGDGQIPSLRLKWASLSEYIKDIKQRFSRFYNKLHHRKGFFWSERFKSVIVENGETLINCLAYIDLNPVRAGIVEKPEAYRWSSLGYHIQTNNKEDFLSLDFGLKEFGILDARERLKYYRQFVYEKGYIDVSKREQINSNRHTQRHTDLSSPDLAEDKMLPLRGINKVNRFLYRSRYFTDSGIIGSKAFVSWHYRVFKDFFSAKHEKRPKTISGLDGVYSLKRLSEKA